MMAFHRKAKTGWKLIYPTIAMGNKENGNLKEYTVFDGRRLRTSISRSLACCYPTTSAQFTDIKFSDLSLRAYLFLALLRGFGPPRKYIRTIWYIPGATQGDIIALLSPVRDIYQC